MEPHPRRQRCPGPAQERIEEASRLFPRLERSARAAWGRARTYVDARRVRTVRGRGFCVRIRLVRLPRHRVGS